VCTDGTASMTDYRLGVVTKHFKVALKEILFTHGIIHREHVAATAYWFRKRYD